MPIEVRELHIKAVVQDVASRPETTTDAPSPSIRFDEMVALCVEQVLSILKEKQER